MQPELKLKSTGLYLVTGFLILGALSACSQEVEAPAPQVEEEIAAVDEAVEDSSMSFFVTSVGSGNGADLGGLAGADQHCQMLAQGVGAGDITWQAYLSTQGPDPVNARDRIGQGPWYNSQGVMIARDIEHLHSDSNNVKKETALNERGELVNGRGDEPNRHDILTGSQLDGTAFLEEEDLTCQNWTNSGEGSAQVGHHDRQSREPGLSPWNSAHPSRGCSQEALQSSGGDGLFYCFAID